MGMSKLLGHIIVLILLASCSTIGEEIGDLDSIHSPITGRIQLNFPVDDSNIPLRCVKRADLSIALTADSLYRKKFLTISNVSDYQSLYEFSLKPGRYFYQAAKTCICGGDTCLWGEYPGGQNGLKWTMGHFAITAGGISYDRINFN